MRVISARSFKHTTWKNGGGITHEIARDSEREDFGWRISIADVNSDGPFSLFPGYQRCLTVISGNGMELSGTSGSIDATLHKPVWFSGDEAIAGHLNDGPCLDFNVIFDPRKFQSTVQIVSDADEPSRGRVRTFSALYRLHVPPRPELSDLAVLVTPQDELRLPENSKAILLRLTAQAI